MKQISNKEYEEYQKYLRDKNNGRILNPDGLQFICAANDYDPEKIGRHMLEVLARLQNKET
jgi:beta-galactosidase GanA